MITLPSLGDISAHEPLLGTKGKRLPLVYANIFQCIIHPGDGIRRAREEMGSDADYHETGSGYGR
jgi:hypothetical protein